jgi:hypothetical protein
MKPDETCPETRVVTRTPEASANGPMAPLAIDPETTAASPIFPETTDPLVSGLNRVCIDGRDYISLWDKLLEEM